MDHSDFQAVDAKGDLYWANCGEVVSELDSLSCDFAEFALPGNQTAKVSEYCCTSCKARDNELCNRFYENIFLMLEKKALKQIYQRFCFVLCSLSL